MSEQPQDGDVKVEGGVYLEYVAPPGEWRRRRHGPPIPPLDAEPPEDLVVEDER